MRHLLFTILILLIHAGLFAQASISGVLNDTNGEPLAFSNVLLLSASDSSLIKGAIVTETGTYSLDRINAGSFLLQFNMVGYAPLFEGPFDLAENEQKIIPTRQLAENIAQLEEVQVVARKPLFEQQMDRLVINVEHSITLTGGTALDVLERSPGVVVNRQNKTLSMGGKDGVVVMINGKMSRMDITAVVQMLAGMPANNIQKIELITTPPANFDAEGNAGIINIILKDNPEDGLNGSASLFAGYGLGEKYGGSLNFNYRQKKINLYGSYSYSFDHNPQVFQNYRSITFTDTLQPNYIGILETNTISDRDPDQIDHNARLGLDIDLGEKTVLGILATGYHSLWRMNAFNNIDLIEDDQIIEQIEIPNDEINQWQNLGGNINLQHTFRDQEILTLDVDYLYFDQSNPTNYINSYFDSANTLVREEGLRVSKKTPIKIYVGKLDYQKKLSDNINLETGLKATASRFTNDVKVEEQPNSEWLVLPDFTAKYFLQEDIAAAYTSIGWQLSDKASTKVGLRYEHTISVLDSEEEQNIVDRNYGNLFPTFYFSYALNENNTFQFAYNRRIQRPTFNDLAPFVIFLGPNTFFSGNPALQPSISDGIRLEYRWKNFLAALDYTYENDAIINYQPSIDPVTNIQTIASENMKSRQTASLMLSLPFYIKDWWVMQNNIMGFWQQNDVIYRGELIALQQISWRASVSQNFTLPKGFGIEVSGFYLSPSLFGFRETKPFGALNFGIQKEFENNGGTLSFSIQDILFSAIWRTSAVDESQNLNYSGEFRFTERVFRLSYSRNFGSSTVKSIRNRATGSEDERNRVN